MYSIDLYVDAPRCWGAGVFCQGAYERRNESNTFSLLIPMDMYAEGSLFGDGA